MQQEDDTKYIKGFNEGYIITRHLPDLSGQLAQVQSNAPRIEGFRDGRKQYVLEQIKDLRPSWMTYNHSSDTKENPSKTKDKDIDHDRD